MIPGGVSDGIAINRYDPASLVRKAVRAVGMKAAEELGSSYRWYSSCVESRTSLPTTVCRIFVMSDARQIEARAGPLA